MYAVAMDDFDPNDPDVELVPVPMNAATRERLVRLRLATGDPETYLAGSLLHSLLKEDEFVHSNQTAHQQPANRENQNGRPRRNRKRNLH